MILIGQTHAVCKLLGPETAQKQEMIEEIDSFRKWTLHFIESALSIFSI